MTEATQTTVNYWIEQITQYESTFKKWMSRVEKIKKRYRDEQSQVARPNATAKFNILWSNVQTIVPAVFSRLPKPDVSRRFKDNDPVGRVAAEILERALIVVYLNSSKQRKITISWRLTINICSTIYSYLITEQTTNIVILIVRFARSSGNYEAICVCNRLNYAYFARFRAKPTQIKQVTGTKFTGIC